MFSDSDADDSPTKKSKSSASATELAEKNDLATYLSSPSTYVSSNPQLSLTREELSEREEVEDLLNRLKQNQKDLFDRRLKNQKDLEGMRGNLKKIRKVRMSVCVRETRAAQRSAAISPNTQRRINNNNNEERGDTQRHKDSVYISRHTRLQLNGTLEPSEIHEFQSSPPILPFTVCTLSLSPSPSPLPSVRTRMS